MYVDRHSGGVQSVSSLLSLLCLPHSVHEVGPLVANHNPPYVLDPLINDYIVNSDIDTYELAGQHVNPTDLNQVFTPGAWVALYTTPTL
jgi:hypothetical protein